MQLREFLSLIKKMAEVNDLSEPFLVGGVPRDKILNKILNMEDLDLTTGDEDIKDLAKLLASKLGPKAIFKAFPDGHASLHIGSLKIDFSSDFKVPNIEKIVGKNLSELEKEMWSRDFTCNALLMNLDLKKIQDPLNRGIQDIERKILKTCLDPKITLGIDNKRIIRVLYLAAKLDFQIDDSILAWIQNNPSKISNCEPEYLVKKLAQTFEYNSPHTIPLIKKLGLAPYLPLKLPQFKEIYVP